VVFDPAKVSYDQILDAFFKLGAPCSNTTIHGGQYRSSIFVHGEEQAAAAEAAKQRLAQKLHRTVVTEITPASTFWRAEEYHQHYYQKNRSGICHF
jgi:peptide-methionine (S)-S-oxide reductase